MSFVPKMNRNSFKWYFRQNGSRHILRPYKSTHKGYSEECNWWNYEVFKRDKFPALLTRWKIWRVRRGRTQCFRTSAVLFLSVLFAHRLCMLKLYFMSVIRTLMPWPGISHRINIISQFNRVFFKIEVFTSPLLQRLKWKLSIFDLPLFCNIIITRDRIFLN